MLILFSQTETIVLTVPIAELDPSYYIAMSIIQSGGSATLSKDKLFRLKSMLKYFKAVVELFDSMYWL